MIRFIRVKALSSLYRVDSVPLLIRPLYLAYSYFIGFILFGYACVVHFTSRIDADEAKRLILSKNFIICLWHQNIWLYFCVFLKHRQHVWLNHPSWYMKPVHVMISLVGVERIILGSTGHDGKKAAEELASFLLRGYSTLLNPDGPAGPAKSLRKGALHLALQTGVQILPLQFSCKRFVRLPGWDQKILPLPFNRIRVSYGETFSPTAESLDTAIIQLKNALG